MYVGIIKVKTYSFLSFADLSTSATVSGIFLLSVSGSIRLSRPATTEQIPKMITGMAAWEAPYVGA
jgi:hypothetical protein